MSELNYAVATLAPLTVSELSHELAESRVHVGDSISIQCDAHWNGTEYELENIIIQPLDEDDD